MTTPTSCESFNELYDVQRKLPCLAKVTTQRVYIVQDTIVFRFEKGWVKSFCPKLITLERYEYRGPLRLILKCVMSYLVNRAS